MHAAFAPGPVEPGRHPQLEFTTAPTGLLADRVNGTLLLGAALLAVLGSFLPLSAEGDRRYNAWSYAEGAGYTQFLGVPLITAAAVALVIATLLLAGAGTGHVLVRAFGLFAPFALATATTGVLLATLYVRHGGFAGGFAAVAVATLVAFGAGAAGAFAIAAGHRLPERRMPAPFPAAQLPPPFPPPFPGHQLLDVPTALPEPHGPSLFSQPIAVAPPGHEAPPAAGTKTAFPPHKLDAEAGIAEPPQRPESSPDQPFAEPEQ
ncbi:hypothetical protein [Nocardia arthritidis]|uniref:hypothetical protein n=1 Tax=Nocardia arthritidis TaxID=228602 RepID=UPI00142E617B|nr:hypothetical protein [Nocardia arthritidis]